MSTHHRYAIIIGLYILVSLLIAAYHCRRPKKEQQKNDDFISEVLSACISLILLPLILNSIGNNSLSDFVSGKGNPYTILELAAYACAVALVSRAVIYRSMQFLKLSRIEKELLDQKKEIEHVNKDQETLYDLKAKSDTARSELDNAYDALLREVEHNDHILIKQENKHHIIKAEENRHINIYVETINIGSSIKCKLTRLGKKYLNYKFPAKPKL